MITRAANDVDLVWTHHGPNTAYEVHRSTIPYFTPSASSLRTTLLAPNDTYTDVGAIGGVGNNYFYKVRSKCQDLPFYDLSADSNQTAEFDFLLVRVNEQRPR